MERPSHSQRGSRILNDTQPSARFPFTEPTNATAACQYKRVHYPIVPVAESPAPSGTRMPPLRRRPPFTPRRALSQPRAGGRADGCICQLGKTFREHPLHVLPRRAPEWASEGGPIEVGGTARIAGLLITRGR